MSEIRPLVLPDTFEDLAKELKDNFAKMSEFIVAVEEAEKQLTIISQSIRGSGKMVLLLGLPGIGKSTFIQSLTWRKHLPIPEIREIDVSDFFVRPERPLNLLYQELQRIVSAPEYTKKPGAVLTVVINYLENLAGQNEDDIRAFFRNVNGLLRRHAVLIIWPVTEENEAKKLQDYAALYGTVFSDEPVLRFQGPPINEFPRIAKDTIAALNPGLSFDDFLINDDELGLLLVLQRNVG